MNFADLKKLFKKRKKQNKPLYFRGGGELLDVYVKRDTSDNMISFIKYDTKLNDTDNTYDELIPSTHRQFGQATITHRTIQTKLETFQISYNRRFYVDTINNDWEKEEPSLEIYKDIRKYERPRDEDSHDDEENDEENDEEIAESSAIYSAAYSKPDDEMNMEEITAIDMVTNGKLDDEMNMDEEISEIDLVTNGKLDDEINMDEEISSIDMVTNGKLDDEMNMEEEISVIDMVTNDKLEDEMNMDEESSDQNSVVYLSSEEEEEENNESSNQKSAIDMIKSEVNQIIDLDKKPAIKELMNQAMEQMKSERAFIRFVFENIKGGAIVNKMSFGTMEQIKINEDDSYTISFKPYILEDYQRKLAIERNTIHLNPDGSHKHYSEIYQPQIFTFLAIVYHQFMPNIPKFNRQKEEVVYKLCAICQQFYDEEVIRHIENEMEMINDTIDMCDACQITTKAQQIVESNHQVYIVFKLIFEKDTNLESNKVIYGLVSNVAFSKPQGHPSITFTQIQIEDDKKCRACNTPFSSEFPWTMSIYLCDDCENIYIAHHDLSIGVDIFIQFWIKGPIIRGLFHGKLIKAYFERNIRTIEYIPHDFELTENQESNEFSSKSYVYRSLINPKHTSIKRQYISDITVSLEPRFVDWMNFYEGNRCETCGCRINSEDTCVKCSVLKTIFQHLERYPSQSYFIQYKSNFSNDFLIGRLYLDTQRKNLCIQNKKYQHKVIEYNKTTMLSTIEFIAHAANKSEEPGTDFDYTRQLFDIQTSLDGTFTRELPIY